MYKRYSETRKTPSLPAVSQMSQVFLYQYSQKRPVDEDYNYYVEEEDDNDYTSDEDGGGFPMGMRIEIRNKNSPAEMAVAQNYPERKHPPPQQSHEQPKRDGGIKLPLGSVKVTEYGDRSTPMTRRRPVATARQSLTTRKSVALGTAQFGIMGAGELFSLSQIINLLCQ